ncbi:MAG: 3-dehydro-L-gulonate 2-dehydrogenase [Saprospiraceae bacterium]|jgi:3-dehydro-L-gulonate 2-dehydrogenase
MELIAYDELKETLEAILLETGFKEEDAALCAEIFSNSTLDGYHSHGVNRFAEFIKTITDGYVQLNIKPERLLSLSGFERWHGNLGPGPLVANFAMNRAIELAKEHGMGCVAMQNSSHWMRGGAYGWQAAEAGCIGICFTNTEPNMPSWGAKSANTGNNPMIVAVPSEEGHIVLDISLSQFSYGKMWEHTREGKDLPFPGGYDVAGNLSTNAKEIVETRRVLPTGYWKGSGLSIMLDLIATLLSDGRSTAKVGEMEAEYGLSQVFICFDSKQLNERGRHEALVNEIIAFVKAAEPVEEGATIEFPGSRTLKRRAKHMEEGIPINGIIWDKLQSMVEGMGN